MAATTLGKRDLSTFGSDDCPARSTRAKRRAIADDNSKPCPLRTVKSTTTRQSKSKKTVPKNVVSSPSKLKSRLKISKPIEIYQDEKDIVIPSTPRHRDALSKKVAVTPKHRVIESKEDVLRTPCTSTRSATAVYNQARQVFSRSSNPGKLIGRESERAEIITFFEERLQQNNGGSLYISGPPGTGKSAMVGEVCEQYMSKQCKISTVNCMSVRNTNDFIAKLAGELDLPEKTSVSDLQRHLTSSDTPFLLILDEVDQLVDLDLALLYNLFEWSLASISQLTLVGIANALDLTDRCLPQLRSRGLKPALLPFLPYTAAQIASVITSKVRSLETEPSTLPPFLHPTAIQFCAKKIAAQTGDLRKAFDICQRAIDLVEQETIARDTKAALFDSPSKTPLIEKINLSSPVTPKSPMKSPVKSEAYTIATAPRATIAHMAKVTSQVFSNGANQRVSSLNLQQKAVLCSLARLEKRKRALQQERVMFATPSKADRSAPTTKQLYEVYAGLCKQSDMLHALTTVEFKDVVSGLEAQGLVTGADGKHGTFAMPLTPSRTPSRKNKTGFAGVLAGDDRRITSVLSEKELRTVLDGAGGDMLREIIDGDI